MTGLCAGPSNPLSEPAKSSIVCPILTLAISIGTAFTPGMVSLAAAAQTHFSTSTFRGFSMNAVAESPNPGLGVNSDSGHSTGASSINNPQSVTITATNFADSRNSLAASTLPIPGAHEAVLSLAAPSRLSFSAQQGSTALHTQTITIRNDGSADTALNWSITSPAAWLKSSPASGSLAGGHSRSVTFVVNPTGLNVGVYDTVATISDPTAVITAQHLQVTLTVNSIIVGYPVLNVKRTFPSDTEMIDVRAAYGARGDGVTDDTDAIQAAISANIHSPNGAILYFPAGIYLVRSPVVYKNAERAWSSALTLQGESQESTIIKLADNNQLYQSSSNPADVLDTASQNTRGNGAGNSAFDNYIFDMTIDVGKGNKGAVALDFMGNNYCGLRNVTLRSSDPNHEGAIGLSMLRYATGPCLMKNIVIDGFDYGIKVANLDYSATFEGLTILNQNLYGIYNSGNVLSVRGLVSINRVPAIHNQSSLGQVTLLQALLKGGSPSVSAIENSGALYARSVTSAGYASILRSNKTTGSDSSIVEYDSGPVQSLVPGNTASLNLPIQDTPQFEDTNLSHWANVVSSAPIPGDTWIVPLRFRPRSTQEQRPFTSPPVNIRLPERFSFEVAYG